MDSRKLEWNEMTEDERAIFAPRWAAPVKAVLFIAAALGLVAGMFASFGMLVS